MSRFRKRTCGRLDEFQPLRSSDCPDTDKSVEVFRLCSKCEYIRSELARIIPAVEAEPSNFENEAENVQGTFPSYATASELQQSCAHGCHLCTLIRDEIFERSPVVPQEESDQDRQNRETKLRHGTNIQILLVRSRDHPALWFNSDWILRPEIETSDGAMACHGVFVRSGEDTVKANPRCLPRYQQDASQTVSTASAAVWELALKWINECNNDHESCGPASTFVPTRLVDVSDPTIRLVADVEGPYMALSYCWGDANVFRLTSDTMQELQSGTSTDRLPATIQDAIKVTQKLNFKYIWIDSLCILQDSHEDWERESRSMNQIYSNATLTIGALGGASSDMGLFAVRNPLSFYPCWMFGDGKADMFAWPWEIRRNFASSFDRSALSSRGWVVQERLMSPRTLNFGSSLVWECRETFRGEYWPRSFPNISLKRGFHVWQSAQRLRQPDDLPVDFLYLWSYLLSLYTGSKLSRRTDRSVALSGLSDLIGEITGWGTVAGLWRPHMLQHLLWQGQGPDPSPRDLSVPSWSWWAIDGKVKVEVFRTKNFPGFKIAEISKSSLADVEVIEDDDQNEPGLHKQCTIRLRCKMTKVTKQQPAESEPELLLDWPGMIDFIFKVDVSPMTCETFHFVPLYLVQYLPTQEPRRHCGLAIVPSSRVEGAYERLGYMEVREDSSGSKELESCVQHTIMLV